MSIPIWQFAPQTATPAGLALLTDAAANSSYSVSDYDHPRSRQTANRLATKGLVILTAGRAAGWEPGMWMAHLTVNGWNTMWRANGDRHDPGCGGEWHPNGTCTGCFEKRRLDEQAFEAYIEATDADERAFLTSHSALFCDEHGYARQSEWSTDKTCRRTDTSPAHQRSFIRL